MIERVFRLRLRENNLDTLRRSLREVGICLAALLVFAAGPAEAADAPAPLKSPETFAQRLCRRYEAIDSVSCSIRKLTVTGGNTVRMLTRVTYQRPLRVHVQITSPSKRRIVSDGETLYYHQSGLPLGFSQPIGELNATWTAAVRNIPGTPMEHLLRLRDLPETRLPEGPDALQRFAYTAANIYVVLLADETDRLVGIDFFKSAAMAEKLATYTYAEFVPAGESCWIPKVHRARVELPGGEQLTETRRIDALRVNQPVDANLFVPALHFTGIAFTNDFTATYGESVLEE